MNISRDRSSQGGNHRKSRDTSSGHLLGGGQKKKKQRKSRETGAVAVEKWPLTERFLERGTTSNTVRGVTADLRRTRFCPSFARLPNEWVKRPATRGIRNHSESV